VFALFCNTHVTPEWQEKYLASFISLSGSFGGSTSPLFSLLTGQWGKLVPKIMQPTILSMARSMGSPAWMVPAEGVFGGDRVAIKTPERTYTLSQLGDALRDSGATRASDFWARFRNTMGPQLTPNVTTHCLYGVSVPSPDTIILSKPLAPSDAGQTVDVTWGDGDGTVLLPGLTACGSGDGKGLYPFVNVSHSDILKSLDAWGVVADIISNHDAPKRDRL